MNSTPPPPAPDAPDATPAAPDTADTPDTADAPDAIDAIDAIDVFWRPGCGYCRRLLRHLDRAGVAVRLHNIWEDDAARRFVRDHNSGDETVPTVAVGDAVVTNPPPGLFVERLRAEHPELIDEADPEPQRRFGRRRHPGDA